MIFEEADGVHELVLVSLVWVCRVQLFDHGVINAVLLEAANHQRSEPDDEGEVTTELL